MNNDYTKRRVNVYCRPEFNPKHVIAGNQKGHQNIGLGYQRGQDYARLAVLGGVILTGCALGERRITVKDPELTPEKPSADKELYNKEIEVSASKTAGDSSDLETKIIKDAEAKEIISAEGVPQQSQQSHLAYIIGPATGITLAVALYFTKRRLQEHKTSNAGLYDKLSGFYGRLHNNLNSAYNLVRGWAGSFVNKKNI